VLLFAGPSLTELLQQHQSNFDQRFDSVFGPSSSSSTSTSSSGSVNPDQLLQVSKAALSNLLGSMGYFYGASLVKLPPESLRLVPKTKDLNRDPRQAAGLTEDPSVVENWNEALFTATPSRSFFPRGFLWDEGFHQLLVQKWDGQVSRDAIAHWLDLMNSQGWIPREQILGAEARARVPKEFVVQYTTHANPPSLLLPLMRMAQEAAESAKTAGAGPGGARDEEAARKLDFLSAAWPRLELWYKWYNTTQAGSVPGSYRWAGEGEGWRRGTLTLRIAWMSCVSVHEDLH
jgi:mannosyl-oligosaccharide glucosidase